jgi:hypothetical protein
MNHRRFNSVPIINGRYCMNSQYGAAVERARANGSELVKAQGEPQPSWLDRFLGLVLTEEEQEQISQLDSNSSDIFRETAESGDAYAQASQNQPVTGEEGSESRSLSYCFG